jgi:hypothetical protein
LQKFAFSNSTLFRYISAHANSVQGVGAGTSSVDAGDQEAAGGGDEMKK